VVVLARKIATWPPGTPVSIVQPYGGDRVMVEVADGRGGTLDILVVDRRALTVTDPV
jgi:hypothetical protein